MKFKEAEITKMRRTIRKSIKEHKRLPESVKVKNTDGDIVKLDKKEFAGLCESRNVYIVKHNRIPKTVTLNTTANNPLVIDYQNDKYSCGPASLSMAIQYLYGFRYESVCKKSCRTNTAGTTPANLIAGAKEQGYKLTQINRNMSSVKKALRDCSPVIAHIDTKLSDLGYINNYGHYILIYGTSGEYYKVADPTKGLKLSKSTILDKAMLNRTIGYYKVEIL